FTAAKQFGVLVGLEIAGADNNRFRIERSGDTADPFTETPHEELPRVLGPDCVRDLPDCRKIFEIREMTQRHRMNSDVVVDDELGAGQADAGIRNSRKLK